MGLIKEPINIDLSGKSKPWLGKELIDLENLCLTLKLKI
jgi:hypothetical protein